MLVTWKRKMRLDDNCYCNSRNVEYHCHVKHPFQKGELSEKRLHDETIRIKKRAYGWYLISADDEQAGPWLVHIVVGVRADLRLDVGQQAMQWGPKDIYKKFSLEQRKYWSWYVVSRSRMEAPSISSATSFLVGRSLVKVAKLSNWCVAWVIVWLVTDSVHSQYE